MFKERVMARLPAEAHPIIFHPAHYPGISPFQADGDRPGLGMAGTVVDGLLKDAEEGCLHLWIRL